MCALYKSDIDVIYTKAESGLVDNPHPPFKLESEYSYSAHSYRPDPLTQIRNAYHMPIDTTEYLVNRDKFHRLYQSLREVSIPHSDMVIMLGNPYAQTIKNWKNISEIRQRVLRSEYPEMDVVTAAYLKWEAENMRISNIQEGIDDCTVDFALFASSVKGIASTATTAWKLFFSRKVTEAAVRNATKIEKLAYKLTEAERKGFRGIRGKIERKNFKACGIEQKRRNIAQIIDGKSYSAHILDQMQNRGIGHLVVENAIRTGIKRVSKQFPKTCSEFYDNVNKITVVVNNVNSSS